MTEILFLAHRIPYPPNKGDKIRSWHFLSHLTQQARVHLGCFVDDERDLTHIPMLEARCAGSYFARLNPLLGRLRSGLAVLEGNALTIPYYRDAGLRAWVEGVMERHRPDLIFVYSSAMAQYVTAKDGQACRRVVDFVDVDSAKWCQLGASSSWPQNLIYLREGRKLLEFERRVADLFDACIFVSASEAELFRGLTSAKKGNICHVSNGVDFDYFSPKLGFADPFADASKTLVFTGMMDYAPNVDAVNWFARDVLPRLCVDLPGAEFAIVGAEPTSEVRKLGRLPGVTVTGRVADVRPYLAHAAAVVAPLRIGRGIQNKVLEAMAMAKAVVCTPAALEGIEATPGDEVLVAEDAPALAQTLATLLHSGKQDVIGQAARRRVQADYTWARNLDRLDQILFDGCAQRPRSVAGAARTGS